MPPPPPKKNVPPKPISPPVPAKPSGPKPFQPNRTFDSHEEIEIWSKTAYKGSVVKVVRVWESVVLNCEITLTPEEKPTKKK